VLKFASFAQLLQMSLGLLPPFPFGWRGSGFEIPEAVLAAYITNLVLSLREDGFTRVYALTPQDTLRLSNSEFKITQFHESQKQAALPLPADSERTKVILMPIGHTEQHGFHLPLCVDTVIIDAIAQGTARSIPGQAYTLPVMPYGVSTHRASFAATMNAEGTPLKTFGWPWWMCWPHAASTVST
jgi:creatinine amidohydrolase/Fe(II)-dependent formamide hydrolase-like protein